MAAGPILQRPLPFKTPPLIRTVTDADAKHVVDDLQAKGVDFIKVGDTLTRDAYFGIASEAKRLKLPFAGHLPVSVTALEATQAGQRSIEHFGSAGFRNVLLSPVGHLLTRSSTGHVLTFGALRSVWDARNPLTDIANIRRVAAVVLGGRLISGADLQRLR